MQIGRLAGDAVAAIAGDQLDGLQRRHPELEADRGRAVRGTALTSVRSTARSPVNASSPMTESSRSSIRSAAFDDPRVASQVDVDRGRLRQGRHQTVRRASVGDTLAARIAGARPAKAPIVSAATIPPAQASGGITADQPLVEA